MLTAPAPPATVNGPVGSNVDKISRSLKDVHGEYCIRL